MDIPSFKMGVRLKRLQQVSQTLERKSRRIFFKNKGNLSQEDVGLVGSRNVRIELTDFGPPRYSKEEMDRKLEQSEDTLFDVALTVICLLETELNEKMETNK